LDLIVVPQLGSGWGQHYSTETRQADFTNEQSMYSLMSMEGTQDFVYFHTHVSSLSQRLPHHGQTSAVRMKPVACTIKSLRSQWHWPVL
jgi:hypothetical protein